MFVVTKQNDRLHPVPGAGVLPLFAPWMHQQAEASPDAKSTSENCYP